MSEHIICHCGKCDVKCNKHGKKAKCADCGKRRMLGTIVKNGKMRHACNPCCEKAMQEIQDEKSIANWQVWDEETGQYTKRMNNDWDGDLSEFEIVRQKEVSDFYEELAKEQLGDDLDKNVQKIWGAYEKI